jgi:hypothetical protein
MIREAKVANKRSISIRPPENNIYIHKSAVYQRYPRDVWRREFPNGKVPAAMRMKAGRDIGEWAMVCAIDNRKSSSLSSSCMEAGLKY